MGILKTMVRLFSYLFHLLLALVLLALCVVTWFSGTHTFQIGILPWQGQTLGYWLLCSALVGLVSVYLATKRILPVVFFIWSLVVLVMLVRGYFFSTYRFGPGGCLTALYLVGGAAIAAVGSWIQCRRKPKTVYRNLSGRRHVPVSE